VDDDGAWKITHLNWFESESIAMGLTRVIVDPDCEVDDDDEDDPYEHQASFLIGTQLDSSSWGWTELGDVVPFFSMPKGGRHVFHTSALAYNTSTMLLVGCNVGSDVAILAKQDDTWNIIDLEEGSQMSCPTDEDDEFLFLMGLGVATLPIPGMQRWHPFPTLASTDGSMTGFVPCHETLGVEFFSRELDGVRAETDMSVALPASSPLAPATVAAGACILGGLDLHLENDESSSLGSLDASDDSDEESEPDQPSTQQAFGTGSAPSFNFATPSFSFKGDSSDATPKPTTSNAFGSATKAGGFTFGSTATSFGFGSPSALGGSAAISTTAKEQPSASKTVFGSGKTAPVFGSNTTFTGGFGSLATSTSESIGFGTVQIKNAENEKQSTKPGSGTAIPLFGSKKTNPFGTFVNAGTTLPGYLGVKKLIHLEHLSMQVPPFLR
jgi:hypothetical protein